LQFYFHTKMESLQEFICKDSLPDWLGGNLTQDEAMDHRLIDKLLSPPRDEWFRKIASKVDGLTF
jgi:hypothetical protein